MTSANYFEGRTLADVYALVGTGAKLAERPAAYPDPDFDAAGFMRLAFGPERRPLLVVHAQATEAIRSWAPAACLAVVGAVLAAHDLNVLEVGLIPVLPEGGRIRCLRGAVALPGQLAILQQAAVFLGVESGFAHAANAMGIPAAVLISAYRQFREYQPWRPGAQDIILRAASPSVNDIPPGPVIAAVETLLGFQGDLQHR